MIGIERARELAEFRIANEYVHPLKERMVDIADFCNMMITGKGQKKIIVKYWLDENEKQLETLFTLYNPMTMMAINPVKAVFKKAYQSDNIRSGLSHENEESLKQIIQAQARYQGNKGISEYLENNLLTFDAIDPNAWIMTNRADVRGLENEIISLTTHPELFSSSQLVDWKENAGITEWLMTEVVRKETNYNDGRRSRVVKDFYFIAADLTLVYKEYVSDTSTFEDGDELITLPVGTREKTYILKTHETGSQEFPALRVGSKIDPENPLIKVPFYWDAEKQLIELINTKVREDITLWKHVFPKVFQYAPKCNYESDAGEICNNGWLDNNPNNECPKCKGTGVHLIRSTQDTLVLMLPQGKAANELLKLSDVIHTETPDINLPTFLNEKTTQALKRVYFAVLNTEMQDEAKVRPETATKIFYDEGNQNAAVQEFVKGHSEHVNLAFRLTAQYTGLSEGFESKHSFTKDLKLETLSTLIARYAAAKVAGLDVGVLFAINCDIMTKLNIDTPAKVALAKAFETHKPFRSKSLEEIVIINQKRANDDSERLIYEHWDRLLQRITFEYPNFYKMDYDERQKLMEAEALAFHKVTKYLAAPQDDNVVDLFTEIEEDEGLGTTG